jgi:hypothetical protein
MPVNLLNSDNSSSSSSKGSDTGKNEVEVSRLDKLKRFRDTLD